MFSVRWFTREAISATASTASGLNWSETPSVFSSSTYWRVRAFSGSLRMRTKSPRVKGSSSTRMGKRPCSSGMRSEGFATWKAPAAMNRMWSVRTIPYLVVTVEPSTMGRRSRCTPCRETSGPCPPSRPAILSSSSRKMMPEFSTRTMACTTASSASTSFWASSCSRSRRASPILSRRRRVRPGRIWDSMSLRLMPTSSIPCPEKTWSIGFDWSDTSISMTRSSSLPARSWARSFSRVASREASRDTSSRVLLVKASPARRGRRRSSSRSSAWDSAFSRTAAAISAFTMVTESSVRSRIMDSTSRPT